MSLPYFHIILIFGLFSASLSASDSDGNPFAVVGEQVNHQIPDGWELAWMSGESDGRFFVEYIPADEEINSWHSGYLLIERIPLPSAEALEEIRSMKTTLPEMALHHFIEQAKTGCRGEHKEISRSVNKFNDILFAMSGGFCSRYENSAPYGEGAFVAFLEGHHNIFRIQYACRPTSDNNKNNLSTWGITPDMAEKFLNAIKSTTLCGSENQPVCQIKYQ
ncbi:hypothetical protein [Methylophaga nitratireducenticrescens]|uniref:Uncharacterized protein n=1 Tax=Methylophaga nitratireducenticrescens TaxID=754476 RepID=I1XJX4_METNJ|nr:hypothetical protein [Methylophaga nitratireducenticrescens]AFI84693.1 hypothetical protein Q7A_1875 [Methylophaga nitratireducenticrescens]AUZ84703.1 hypothetical protein CDW43_08970 [Methylophaga nitratireducenticrescens]